MRTAAVAAAPCLSAPPGTDQLWLSLHRVVQFCPRDVTSPSQPATRFQISFRLIISFFSFAVVPATGSFSSIFSCSLGLSATEPFEAPRFYYFAVHFCEYHELIQKHLRRDPNENMVARFFCSTRPALRSSLPFRSNLSLRVLHAWFFDGSKIVLRTKRLFRAVFFRL